MQKITHQRKAYLLALLAVLIWSTMSSAFKITLRFLDVDSLLFGAVINGIIILGIVGYISKRPLRFRQLSAKEYMSSALMGFFNPFLYYLVLFKAYDLLEAQEAGTLNYIWPIVLVFFSMIFLKQKIRWQAIVSIFISFGGILIISTHGHPLGLHFSNRVGVALAVGSAIFWAAYWILNMKDKREDVGKILLNLIFGLLYLVIYFIVIGKIPAFYSWQGIVGSLYIGIFEMSITFVVWLKALNYSKNTAKVSNLIYLSPFLGLLWIHLTVGEEIHLYTFVGLTFIVGGIILQRITEKRTAG